MDSTAVLVQYSNGFAGVALSPKPTLLYDSGLGPYAGEGFARSIGVANLDGEESVTVGNTRFRLLPIDDGWTETFGDEIISPLEMLRTGFPVMVLGYADNVEGLDQHDQQLFCVVVYPDYTYKILMGQDDDNIYLTAPDDGRQKQWFISNINDRLTPNVFGGFINLSWGHLGVNVLNGDAEVKAVADDVIADFCVAFALSPALFDGKYAGQLFSDDNVYIDEAIASYAGFPLTIVAARPPEPIPAKVLDPTTIGVVPAGSAFLIPVAFRGSQVGYYLAQARVDIPADSEELPAGSIDLVVNPGTSGDGPWFVKVNRSNLRDWSNDYPADSNAINSLVTQLATATGIYHTASHEATWYSSINRVSPNSISALARSVVGILPAE